MNDHQFGMDACLTISLVTYAPDLAELESALLSLRREIRLAISHGVVKEVVVYIIDNGPGEEWEEKLWSLSDRIAIASEEVSVTVLSGQGNVGFGSAHNLAIFRSLSEFHLILNPDIIISPDSLIAGIMFLRKNDGVVLVSPSAVWPSGERQYLCKSYPALFDLMLRGMAPKKLQHVFDERLKKYELRYLQSDNAADVPIASGCFMLARRQALVDVGGFSPKYFMYFEDFDLSLRLGRVGRIVYHPGMRIVHAGGHAAKKGWRHILMFAKSAFIFFNTHGWKLY